MIAARPTAAFAFSHPAHVLAFGFGAGLSPLAPGTAGTALGWLLGWLLGGVSAPSLIVALAAALFVIGVWACDLTGRRLGASDHGAMVWDEMVAFLLVLALVPRELAWQAGAFVLFRLFDIAKPPPIRSLERRFRNGFGVMLDDLVAAGYVLLVLALARRLAA
jgi:phosphatidylglycerophosphatase A